MNPACRPWVIKVIGFFGFGIEKYDFGLEGDQIGLIKISIRLAFVHRFLNTSQDRIRRAIDFRRPTFSIPMIFCDSFWTRKIS